MSASPRTIIGVCLAFLGLLAGTVLAEPEYIPFVDEIEWVDDTEDPLPSIRPAGVPDPNSDGTSKPAGSANNKAAEPPFLLPWRLLTAPPPGETLNADENCPSRLLPPPEEVIQAPISLMGVLTAPVRDAHLLLPAKLDPFAKQADGEVPAENEEDAELAKLAAEQRALLGPTLHARAPVPDAEAHWQWAVDLGGSFRQGNSSNTNLASGFRMERHSIFSDNLLRAGLIYNDNGGDDVNRRAFGEYLHDRNLRGNWIWYGRTEAEYDERNLIDLRNLTSTGLGYRFLDSINQRWIMRSGPTATYIIYSNPADNNDEFRAGWLLESEYRRLIWEKARIEWTSTAFPDFDSEQQFRLRNEAAIVFPIGGNKSSLSWRISVWHQYQFNPVPGTQPSDVQGSFSILYSNGNRPPRPPRATGP